MGRTKVPSMLSHASEQVCHQPACHRGAGPQDQRQNRERFYFGRHGQREAGRLAEDKPPDPHIDDERQEDERELDEEHRLRGFVLRIGRKSARPVAALMKKPDQTSCGAPRSAFSGTPSPPTPRSRKSITTQVPTTIAMPTV